MSSLLLGFPGVDISYIDLSSSERSWQEAEVVLYDYYYLPLVVDFRNRSL